jgi:hypothetical protein
MLNIKTKIKMQKTDQERCHKKQNFENKKDRRISGKTE